MNPIVPAIAQLNRDPFYWVGCYS